MYISELLNHKDKPELYCKGNSFMWTDEHISKQLLQIHLNKDIDLASRKEDSILRTVDWLLSGSDLEKMKILDLGCGPGLYTAELARAGHDVTGIDISDTSVSSARSSAHDEDLPISYLNANYLEAELGESEFDLIIMIYTDFGVLNPDERTLLLDKIRRALKPEGRFVFDVLNDHNFGKMDSEMSWEAEESGFWSKYPYLHLSKSYVYKGEKVVLYQHLVMDDTGSLKTYNFWTHFFSHKDIAGILDAAGMMVSDISEDVLIETDQWSGRNVSFVDTVLK